ncbi:hypothetical protein V5O48_009000 [Marasmius crinis-equi]|uniref:Gfd2/YDR514C-like C-terminal domain-containing protein n=1 Tax=Marasmius crinis-equi TaxID=585013 RepID=A0ABR3FCC9_9AGAR
MSVLPTYYYLHSYVLKEWSVTYPFPMLPDQHPSRSTTLTTATAITALRNVLAVDGWVHLEHPLRVADLQGVPVFVGVFESGHRHVVLSSKQLEAIVNWLRTNGHTTDHAMPPPSARVTEGHDVAVEKTLCRCAEDVMQLLLLTSRKNAKRDKALRKEAQRLQLRQARLDEFSNKVAERTHTLLSIDIEAFEGDHQIITEFGYSKLSWVNGDMQQDRGHLIVEEHTGYRNGNHVEDNRWGYAFGTSEVLPKTQFRLRIAELLAPPEQGALILVFHDANGDIRFLQTEMIQAPIQNITFDIPKGPILSGLFGVDTTELFGARESDGGGNRTSLLNMCRALKIDTSAMHNAGNDAFVGA